MSPIMLYSSPQMESLARQIRGASVDINLGTIRWSNFRDGWPDFFIEDVRQQNDALVGRDVVFLASFENPTDCLVQQWVASAFGAYQARSLTFVLPYFPTGTMERMDEDGRIVTAKSLARHLSSMPSGLGLKNRLVIFDIHALPEWHIFEGTNVVPILDSAIPLLEARLRGPGNIRNVSIVFPDEGAFKRFGRQLRSWPQIICEKRRDGSKREIRIKEGDPMGRHCVIVDDLAQSGETQDLTGCVLAKAGAKAISCFVTHMVTPNESWRRFLRPQFPLKYFWFSDSCPWSARQIFALTEDHPFELVSLAQPIVNQMMAVRSYFQP